MSDFSTLKNANVALFIDLESLMGLTSQIGLPVNLSPVIEKLVEEFGRVTIRRSFGDLDKSSLDGPSQKYSIRQMLQQNSVLIEDVPYVNKYKNSSDIRLAVEALSIAYTHPHIDHFAILSTDQDYRPLINKLKELGKTTIGIGGSRETTNESYIRSCDVFIYYEALFDKSAFASNETRGNYALGGSNGLRDEYIDLLMSALAALENRGAKSVGANIVPQMRWLKPDYDLPAAGFYSFRELVQEAEKRNLVRTIPSGADIAVESMQTRSSAPKFFPMRFDVDSSNPEAMLDYYRTTIDRNLLKCKLPTFEQRERIYSQVETSLESEQTDEGIPLVALSEDITDALSADWQGIIQPSIYKTLFALYRQGCFVCEASEQMFNPLVLNISKPRSLWDDAFIRNTLRGLRQYNRGVVFLPELIAEVFERPTETIEQMIQEGI